MDLWFLLTTFDPRQVWLLKVTDSDICCGSQEIERDGDEFGGKDLGA